MSASAIRPGTCARCGTAIPDTGQSCPACGLSLSAGTAVLAPPTGMPHGSLADEAVIREALAGEYDLLEELGRGGMAVVYRARDRALRREVAVKVLPLTHTFDAEFVERFQQEARTAAALEHPNIIPIYRVGTSGSVSYFVMKYLRGRSLSDVLTERRVLPLPELRRLLREVGSALAYAAKQSVVHRDVKPDNIMLDESGRFVVTDFGIARSGAAPRLTATGMSVGTPRYMSPEQARAKSLDGRSDIYSLGIVAYQCLVGRVPFEGEEAFGILYAHINSPVPRPPLTSTAEWELFELIERMLRKDPDERVQDGDELVRLVEACAERATIAAATGQAASLPATSASRAIADTRAAMAMARRFMAPVAPVGGKVLRAVKRGGVVVRDAGRRTMERASTALPVLANRVRRATGGAIASGGRIAGGHSLAAIRAGRSVAVRGWRRARAVPAVAWATATRRRTIISGISAVMLLAGLQQVTHAALHHRSRCPAAGGGDAASTLAVLLDAPAARPEGGSVVLHYDVCGLAEGSAYSTQLTIARSGGAIRRILGGPAPLVEKFAEQADGPATRRHRRIDLGSLPAGSYSIELAVTGAGGKRRRETRELRIE